MAICPVCSSEAFDSYGGRIGARCVGCGALERGRLSWLILERLELLRPGVRFLNCAPEPFMLIRGAQLIGNGYIPTDFDPTLYAKWNRNIIQFDMCNPEAMILGPFDCIMHNHVLEHIPCDVPSALRKLNKHIVPGGVHMFSTPIMPDRKMREDLSPDLSPEDKLRLFGQNDHVRMFGALDFMDMLKSAGMNTGLLDVSAMISEDDLANAGLNPEVFNSYNSNRVFVWRRGV